jgi:cyclase
MKKLLFIALLISISLYSSAQTFQSKHFTVQKLSDGVWAAIAKSGGYAICNAGIVDLGENVLIVDPFLSPEAAMDLNKTAEELTHKKVRYVVNTHYHSDHIGGNVVFKDATIITTENTRGLIDRNKDKNFDLYKNQAPIKLDELKKMNTTKMTPHELDDYTAMKGYYEAMVNEKDSVKPRLADVTFIDRLAIYGSDRRVLLMTYGSAHTESDMFVFLPNEQISFLGDLLTVQSQPLMLDADIAKWDTYLNNLEGLNMKTLVPGHGPVGGAEDLKALKGYLKNINETAKGYVKNGKSPKDDAALKSPSAYENWSMSDFYKMNVAAEYGRLSEKQK